VDDILLIGNDITLSEVVESSLRKNFSMKDLGEVVYILGIKIYREIIQVHSIKPRCIY
jgi:hypothetical protein